MTVEIFKSKTAKVQPWYVTLVADNGQKLTTSEGYFSRWNATRAAKRMFPLAVIEYVDK
jgi:uncharacterized protein YegP (UPF0339 family)